MSTTITVHMSEEDKEFITRYAKSFGISAGRLMRFAAIEALKDEIDTETYNSAKAEFDKDPTPYTFDEIRQRLGL